LETNRLNKSSPLRILHLEDNCDDAALVTATLESQGITCATTRVDTRRDFMAALERGGIDLILSDFSLPTFDGLSALQIARTTLPDVPVILVSGTLGEELAIEALQKGATDYVLKERLARLAPAVRRAMLEVAANAERQRLEAQFIEAQKMEAIGQLASGVAHDFNNMLAVILGHAEFIASGLASESPLQKSVEEVRHAAQRAVGLTQQLLLFSRKQTVQPVVLDINAVVKDLTKMLCRLVDENIEMTIAPGDRAGRIRADPGYLGQLLMNLVVNARDAMPNGGKLLIATVNVTLDQSHARIHPGTTPGDYVMLSVRDTGTGITDEVKAHLFEAFFTTKPKGKGTGLGLSTCQSIVQQSGGHIAVSTELGRGTTFKVYFPRVRQPLDQATGSVVAGPLPRGTETVMVVEDEPSLRYLACSVLEAQGYQVLSASNGQDALHVAQAHVGSPIRVVVSDVIMPLMGGKVMAEWLKTANPELKVLFTSGYTDDSIAPHGVLEPGVAFLPKPYTSAALSLKVREMLDDADSCSSEKGKRTEAHESTAATR